MRTRLTLRVNLSRTKIFPKRFLRQDHVQQISESYLHLTALLFTLEILAYTYSVRHSYWLRST